MKNRKNLALVSGLFIIFVDILIVIYLINLWFRLFDSSILTKILIGFTLLIGFMITWRQIYWIQKRWGPIPWIEKKLKED